MKFLNIIIVTGIFELSLIGDSILVFSKSLHPTIETYPITKQESSLIQGEKLSLNPTTQQLLQTGQQQFQTSQFKAALNTYQQALALFQKTNNKRGEAETLFNIGVIYRVLSQYSQATEFVEQALEIAESLNYQNLIASALSERGVIAYSLSQFPEALKFYQQAIELSQKIGDRHTEGRTLDHMGVVYRRQGNYNQALSLHQQALAILQEINQKSAQALVLNNIGIVYSRQGNYPNALEYNQKALAISREFGDRYIESRILLSLGVVYQNLSQYSQAQKLFQEALNIKEEIGDQIGVGQTLNNLGGVYNSLGEYSQALEIYQKALRVRRSVGDRIGEGITLSNIGLVYQNRGEYFQAQDYYQQALAISQKIGDRPGEASALMNLGGVASAQSQYTEAVNFYQQSLKIRQEIGDRAGEGYTLNSIGAIYYTLGQFNEALKFYQQALTLREEIGDIAGTAQALNNMGLVYEVQKQYNKALEYYQQALKIRREIGDRPGEGNSLNNIGFIYNINQQYTQALEVYQQALRIRQTLGDRFGEATTLNNLGLAYNNLGNQTEALVAYQQALGIFQEIGSPEGERSTLSSMGEIFDKQNKVELAIIFYKKSVNVTEAIRQNLSGLSTEQQQSYTGTVADTYRRLADLLLQQNRVLEAQQVLDLLKVQELDEYLNNVRGNNQTSEGIELLPQEQQAYQEYTQIQNQIVQLGTELNELRIISPEERSPEQNRRIVELENIQQQVRQDFNNFIENPEVQAKLQQLSQTTGGQNLDLPNLNRLQRQLRQIEPTAVLLYPLILENRVELILVTPFNPPIHRSVTIERKVLNQVIVDFRLDIVRPSVPLNQVKISAQRLYKILIKPLEGDLTQANAKTIIYAPDSVLRYIPISALHDGNQWLIERFNINNITAASLTDLSSQDSKELRVLAGAFSSGNYQVQVGSRQFSFDGLTYAGLEVQNISKRVPQTTTLINQEFNRNAVIPFLNDHTIVHLATHAAFVPGQPEDSFILLGDGDRLTLREIETLNLPNVTLVILSACQTAVGGQLGNGEEILGLGYQMQQAGVLATIASLWIVDDQGTQVFMEAFYNALLSGKYTKAEALRQAQVNLSQNLTQDNRFSHPYYWAPFILIGNGLSTF
ncbi:CHAT domain-containing protein [Limnoraphis robusta]|uniref:CHAT domain-containing protein n=1 Tax=Limnoraphis robusta TaxID=1118279 RepID=UPI002B21A8DE|nr:tetratricopeptide repeat protein [Limnoraphis robusta]MEA5498378.1 tetratricopeptide repeat protein [Limnoraphis robusta BA-68 BA1]